MRRSRIVLFGCGSIAWLCLCAALLIMQSSWFRDQVRLRIIAAVEHATGGRAELKAFDYHWHTLTADIQGFVLRGTEPPGSVPFFQAQHVQLQFQMVSLLKRDINLYRLTVDRPSVYILVRPDGTTNIPPPQMDLATLQNQLLKLAVRRFDWQNGKIEVDGRKFAFNLRGEGLTAGIRYNGILPGYSGTLNCEKLNLHSEKLNSLFVKVQSGFDLSRNRLAVKNLAVSTAKSYLSGSGLLWQFAHPQADFHLGAHLDLSELAALANLPELRSGLADINGTASYNGQERFAGLLNAQQITYRQPFFQWNDVALRSTISGNAQKIVFSDLRLHALDASLTGEAQLEQFRQLAFKGRVDRLNLSEASRLFAHHPLALNSAASGPVELRAHLDKPFRDASLSAALDLTPGSQNNGVPVGGSVHLRYERQQNLLYFEPSRLVLPQTSVDFSGTLGRNMSVALNSANLADLELAAALWSQNSKPFTFPVRLDNGSVSFTGTLDGPLTNPSVLGHLSGSRVQYNNFLFDSVSTDATLDADQFAFRNTILQQAAAKAFASGHIALSSWKASRQSPFGLRFQIQNFNLSSLTTHFTDIRLKAIHGQMDLAADLTGTFENPQGTGKLHATGVDADSQPLDDAEGTWSLVGNRFDLQQGILRVADANLALRGSYLRSAASWTEGQLTLQVDTNGFQVHHLVTARIFEPDLRARLEAHFQFSALVGPQQFALETAIGKLRLNNLRWAEIPYGSVAVETGMEGRAMNATFEGNLRESRLSGKARMQLTGDYQAEGDLQVSPIQFSTLKAVVPVLQTPYFPGSGLLQGSGRFAGPLTHPERFTGSVRLEQLRFRPVPPGSLPADIALDTPVLHNAEPIVIDYRNQTAVLHSFQMLAENTQLDAAGQLQIGKNSTALDLKLNGTLNLQLLRTFNPDLAPSGISIIKTAITGPLSHPDVNGTLELQNASFYAANFASGLEHANGLIRFDGARATIQRLTAQSGGGNVSFNGFINYGAASPVVYRLNAHGEDLRIRYNGISLTLNSDLKYNGTSQGSVLSGSILVNKASFNPSTDVGGLFALNSSPAAGPASENSFLHRIRLEIDIESNSSLQVATAVSQNVEAEVDLRLRGTPDNPALLGRFALSEGQIQFFGTKYNIDRGEVDFSNPLKIEPVLDLSLQTQARGITINISVTGPLEKLNINYRSDPPLQSSEIIALLATGRAPDATSRSAGAVTANQNSALAGPTTILGSTLSPVSGRLQRFFGVTHLKIDPMLQGIADVPQARLTLEQQISKQITITYVTNLSRTAEQIFRFEWAFSREYSVIAIRDENGLFGIDVQYRKRFH